MKKLKTARTLRILLLDRKRSVFENIIIFFPDTTSTLIILKSIFFFGKTSTRTILIPKEFLYVQNSLPGLKTFKYPSLENPFPYYKTSLLKM